MHRSVSTSAGTVRFSLDITTSQILASFPKQLLICSESFLFTPSKYFFTTLSKYRFRANSMRASAVAKVYINDSKVKIFLILANVDFNARTY
jgi:hypothetical protein